MGLYLFLALGVTVTDARGLQVLQVNDSWPEHYLFSGMKGFVHQPTVNPAVRPVIQPLQRIALALRDAVEVELCHLVEAAVIEPVDTSHWVSNLVIAKKKRRGWGEGDSRAISMAPLSSARWICGTVTCRSL